MTDAAEQLSLEFDDLSESEIAAAVEALLFASGEGEPLSTLAAALGWRVPEVRRATTLLETQLADGKRGIVLQRDGDSVRLVSAARFGTAVGRLLGIERQTRLSPAALETLALVAYRQPATRSEIDAVRGVDSSGVLATLVARELIEPLGRRATPGNPVEYGTTPQFLQFFGLTSLSELPEPPALEVDDEPVEVPT